MNHNGSAIYSLQNAPYIYGNGYDPNTAEVVWESISGLITSLSITDDKYLKFYVNPDKVNQANAVIAVKSSGTIVWSWHLWFTASSWTATYKYGSNNFMTMPLGFIDSSGGGTPRTLPFTFTQGISSGTTTTVLVSQNGDASTGGPCTFYQWGRKDPFPGATANGQATDYIASQPSYNSSIQNPGKFIQGASDSQYNYNWFKGNLFDLWNVGNSVIDKTTSTSQKTIYDPSPVGFKVPPPAAFYTEMLVRKSPNDFTAGYRGTVDGDFWHAFGFLRWETGSSDLVGTYGQYWSCGPSEYGYYRYGLYLNFFSGVVRPQDESSRSCGMSVRPVSE